MAYTVRRDRRVTVHIVDRLQRGQARTAQLPLQEESILGGFFTARCDATDPRQNDAEEGVVVTICNRLSENSRAGLFRYRGVLHCRPRRRAPVIQRSRRRPSRYWATWKGIASPGSAGGSRVRHEFRLQLVDVHTIGDVGSPREFLTCRRREQSREASCIEESHL